MLIFFQNCTKTIEVELPPHDSKPVVNCLFTSDSLMNLRLSQSASIFETLPPAIESAEVKLYEEGVFKEYMVFNNDEYESTFFPAANKNYRVEINTPGLDEVYAEDYIPFAPNLLSASFVDSVYVDEEGDFFSYATIEFKDESLTKNYYELELLRRSFLLDSQDTINDPIYYKVNNSSLLNEGFYYCSSGSMVFSDDIFNNQKYTLTVNYITTNFGEFVNLLVILRAVSKDYYDYKKSLAIHLASQENDIWDGIVEPSQVISNINGGYGIFAGYSEKVIVLNK